MTLPPDLRDQLLESTVAALKAVRDPRFHRTERGFQGQFYCALQGELVRRELIDTSHLLEMEAQKSLAIHSTVQRPDIILHVPRETAGTNAADNNVAVWALKRRASESQARDDFAKLDTMLTNLRYAFGFFVNIDDARHHANAYAGAYPDRLIAIAATIVDGAVHVTVGRAE